MDESKAKLLTQQMNSAMSAFVRAHSVALHIERNGKSEVASGTCLRVADRFFIATAGHPLLNLRSSQINIIHSNQPGFERVPYSAVGICGGHDGDTQDVGFLELEATQAETLQRSFLTLSELDFAPTLGPNVWLFLFGYPTALLPIDKAALGTFAFSSLGLITVAVPTTQYPPTASTDIDLVIEYPATGKVGSEDAAFPLPHPGGVSGGSIWLLDPNRADPLVGFHHARWIGIQRAWVPAKRMAYGNRLRLLAQLLLETYPELASVGLAA